MAAQRRAAIDIGTVTARMLVADVEDNDVRELIRRSRITHLGEGWATTGVLSEAGISRTAEAVAAFASEAHEMGAERIAAVATSASRDARNSQEFIDRLAHIGIRATVISGDDEAYLTFLGAACGLDGENIMVVDVGGGSTEVVIGDAARAPGSRAPRIEASRSFDVGSRRVTELFLRSDPPSRQEMEEASRWVAAQVRGFFNSLDERPEEMVSVAGTATSLAAIDLQLDPYDSKRVHGYRLSGASLLDILERLSRMSLEERRHVTGLEPERAGVIVGGALVLQTVMAYAGLTSTLVSEHDILYGIVLDPDRVM